VLQIAQNRDKDRQTALSEPADDHAEQKTNIEKKASRVERGSIPDRHRPGRVHYEVLAINPIL
jgi:hypothetical protein